MQVIFKSFKEWGEGTFAIEDFKGITNDDTNYYLAGTVIFEDDIYENILDFIDMAAEAGAAIIMIDYSNVGLGIFSMEGLIEKMEDWGYRDLLSYENRLAFGLTDETDEEFNERTA